MTCRIACLAALLALSGSVGAESPTQLPAPTSAAPTITAPTGAADGCPGSCAACAKKGSCSAGCWQRLGAFLCYCPVKSSCCEGYRNPPTPPVYTYFDRPVCQKTCGISDCGRGCDGFVSKCGFCTPGHRMFGLFSGFGFGFCGTKCGSCGGSQ